MVEVLVKLLEVEDLDETGWILELVRDFHVLEERLD